MIEVTDRRAARQDLTPQKIPEPSLASVFLAHELISFNRLAKARLVGPEFDQEYWRRQWRTRERAREIIEGRRRWPHDLLHWKLRHEMRYFHHGRGAIPPWCDPSNWTREQREHARREELAFDKYASGDPKAVWPPPSREPDFTEQLLEAAWARPRKRAKK